MIFNLKNKNIPIILINGRITKKSFNRWSFFKNFSKKIFEKFNLCFSSNNETQNFLIQLGSKRNINVGNLKFSQSEIDPIDYQKNLKKISKSKKIWCASSTHFNEENLCGLVHKQLKQKYNNLLTIIIPRHINRSASIKNSLNNLGLNVYLYESIYKIKNDTDVLIVNAYGKTKSFYNDCKNVFLGGSLIKHGGQNPLEAARFGCNILHGPNISNFTEIYKFLNKNKISHKVYGPKMMAKKLDKLFSKKKGPNKIKKKINLIGQKILNDTYREIRFLLKNDI